MYIYIYIYTYTYIYIYIDIDIHRNRNDTNILIYNGTGWTIVPEAMATWPVGDVTLPHLKQLIKVMTSVGHSTPQAQQG